MYWPAFWFLYGGKMRLFVLKPGRKHGQTYFFVEQMIPNRGKGDLLQPGSVFADQKEAIGAI